MTPMIDMSFQLIAFFMLALNFSETIVDQNIRLPISELARPPDRPPEQTLILNMNADGRLNHLGRTLEVPQMGSYLADEREAIRVRVQAGVAMEETIVVVRADGEAPSGKVQELIQLCQQHGFERFDLRAKQKED